MKMGKVGKTQRWIQKAQGWILACRGFGDSRDFLLSSFWLMQIQFVVFPPPRVGSLEALAVQTAGLGSCSCSQSWMQPRAALSSELRWLQWGQAKFRKLRHKEEAEGALVLLFASRVSQGAAGAEGALMEPGEPSPKQHPQSPHFLLLFIVSAFTSQIRGELLLRKNRAFGATFPRHPRNPFNSPASTAETLQKFPWQGYLVV